MQEGGARFILRVTNLLLLSIGGFKNGNGYTDDLLTLILFHSLGHALPVGRPEDAQIPDHKL